MIVRTLLMLLVATTALAGCLSETPAPVDDVAVAPTLIEFDEPVPEGEYDFTGPYSRPLTEGALAILEPFRVDLPSALDGENIEMAVWLPDGEGPFPVILFSSPYFFAKDGAGAQTGFNAIVTGTRTVDNPGGSVQAMIDAFVPHGYAFVTHAVRGTAGSTGCNDLMGPKELADIDQAVTFIGEAEWSSGAIAMTGVSYDGSTPWSAATFGNPYLKTIIPISGVPDMYGLMYRNGSSEMRGPLVLNALYIGIGIGSGPMSGLDYAERIACPDALAGLGLSGVAGVTGNDPTGYWQERNKKDAVAANYQGSIFSIQGMQDWNVDPSQVVPWVDELEAQGLKTKQLLGQWGHAWPDGIGEDGERADMYRADYKEILLRWLDSELKGLEVETGPAVQVMDNQGRWRNELHYPPHDTTWTNLYLNDDFVLSEEPNGNSFVVLTPNPGALGFNAGFLAQPLESYVDFTMGPVEEETLVVGLPKVHVQVTPHGPGGYLAAYLYDRAPDGGLTRLGWTTMNLAFADGSTERTEVVPGMPLDVKMEIQPMDGVVPAGHELVLRMWVFTDGDRLPTIPPNGVNLELGEVSVLKLPTVERGPEYYFEAPQP